MNTENSKMNDSQTLNRESGGINYVAEIRFKRFKRKCYSLKLVHLLYPEKYKTTVQKQ